ncbi:expressed unknown protein [Seminavis robusta]|uniref:Nucleolar 27S pre-rRNA processing Urb2/Npa2 C-terminal domain-containing protein n=1 Tax=Seminavis robusta TaxID=568900 RepID=A0A9N8EFS1_9STRA|nr:expressed unknown protein [Seminavis robusta]|eukprot:Sro925_g220920.1 n/a (1511) ;mRNA; f:32044-36576
MFGGRFHYERRLRLMEHNNNNVMSATSTTSTRRKRELDSSVPAIAADKKDSSKKTRRNPFLDSVSESRGQDDDEDNRLEHTVTFLHFVESQQHLEKVPRRALQYLTEFLEAQQYQSPDECYHQSARTAASILSWAVKALLATAEKENTPQVLDVLLWRSLAASLRIMASLSSRNNQKTGNETMLFVVENQILSGNVLLNLIPQASAVGNSANTKASAYAATCHGLLIRLDFVPSFEMVCNSYLSGIVIDDAENGAAGKLCQPSSEILEILHIAAKAIQKLNPKKAFQVLAKQETLLQFTRLYLCLEGKPGRGELEDKCQDMILNTILSSFFDSDHWNGFHGLVVKLGCKIVDLETTTADKEPITPSTTRQCYQESLLQSLENMLLAPSTEQNSELATRLFPLILQILFEKLSEVERKNKRQYTSSRKNDESTSLQLFFFVNMTSICLRAMSKTTATGTIRSHCMESLDQCLKLWSQKDPFVLPDGQRGRERYLCLESIASVVLKNTSYEPKWAAIILKSLVRLEHTLVQESDKLEAIVHFVVGSSGAAALKLFATILETFGRLRQFHRIVVTLLRVATAIATQSDASMQLKTFTEILSHSDSKDVFARSVRGSPIVEARKMLESLNSWIGLTAAWNNNTSDARRMLLEFGVRQIGVGLLCNVKVDESTAPIIAHCCEKLTAISVKKLCSRNHQELGVSLCRWATNSQMRCAFWLGHKYSEGSELESSATSCIRDLVLTAAIADSDPEAIDDMLYLASFRLRRLDFLIRNRHPQEVETLTLHWQYDQEARRIAMLMAQWAERPALQGSGWQVVARVLTSWVPYATENQIQRFLVWIFSAIAEAPSARSATALSLVNDPSFLELPELSLLLKPCAIATVAQMLEDVPIMRTASNAKGRRKQPDDADNRFDWQVSCSKELEKLLAKINLSADGLGTETRQARTTVLGALRVVNVVNAKLQNLPHASIRYALAALHLEAACRGRLGDEGAKAVDLISSLRLMSAREFASAGPEGLKLFPATSEGIQSLLGDISESSIRALGVMDDGTCRSRLVSATAELATSLTRWGLKHTSNKIAWKGLYGFVRERFAPLKPASDADSILVLCALARSVLSAFSSVDGHDAWPDHEALESLLLHLFDWATLLSSYPHLNSTNLLRDQVCLLMSTLFQFASNTSQSTASLTNAAGSLSARLFPLVLPTDETVPTGMSESAMITVGCFSNTKPPLRQRHYLIDQLLRGDLISNDKLKVAISSLVHDMEGDSLHYAISNILRSERNGLFHGVLLFPLLVQSLQQSEQVEIAHSFSDTVKHHCLAAFSLLDNWGRPDESIAVVCRTMVDLLQEKRFQAGMSERDISEIMASISKVVGSEQLPNTIFVSCFHLMAALIQLLPQRVLSCVTLLATVLQCLLLPLLSGKLDESMMKRGCQDFSRLCELLSPNKDVLKKHALSLLLELLHYLELESIVWRKECVTSCLLHIVGLLSQFEIEQLTTQTTPAEKIIFRPLHESYQKKHAHHAS